MNLQMVFHSLLATRAILDTRQTATEDLPRSLKRLITTINEAKPAPNQN